MREKPEHIPLDVVEIILSKLPIKDVLRFKTVSKSWNATILDPRFARIHLDSTYYDDDDDNRLFMWSEKGIYYHLGRFNGSDFDAISRLMSPLKKLSPLSSCSCDGFFLIYDTKSGMYAWWNPITQSKMSFAHPGTMGSPDQTPHGICYDPLEDDYKVVFIVDRLFMFYTVFSCRNDSLTETKPLPHWANITDPGVSVRGVPYWVVFDRTNEQRNGIVYFDAKDCAFKKFHKPDEVKETDLILVTSLNGRLCLYQKSKHSIVDTDIDIWVLMQDNITWTKLTSSPPPSCAREIMKKAVARTENGRSIYSLYIAGLIPIILSFDESMAANSGRCPWKITYLSTTSKVFAMRGSLALLPPPKIAN